MLPGHIPLRMLPQAESWIFALQKAILDSIGCCRGEDRDCRPAPSFGEITRETDPRIHVPLRIRPLVIADKLFISRHSIDIYIPYKPLRHASMYSAEKPLLLGSDLRGQGLIALDNEVRQVDGVADSDAVGRRGLEDSTISRVRIACF